MTKKKRPRAGIVAGRDDTTGNSPLNPSSPSPASPSLAMPDKPTQFTNKAKLAEPSTSALIICRNKHWRYISSFHGPWLQLPPEVLETLAYSNHASLRPRPIDPAVFFDLVKVRRLVEDATDLAVRAANGTTSSSLSNALNAGSGMLGGGGAAALGLGIGGGGGNAKLSKERKHRMRELATQKLSHAYYLDEIAASVATMQSASALEEVAKFVLQRSSTDSDAKYVHFFHEKIPSRMLAQCTSLMPLDEIIHDRPTDGAPLRTRAVTRVFKDDYHGAVRDLTEGLAVCRYTIAQHRVGRGELEPSYATSGTERKNSGARDWKSEPIVKEEGQPSSLESQLLFHRAGVYLTLACQHVDAALDDSISEHVAPLDHWHNIDQNRVIRDAQKHRLEARKLVKTNAKRALRDYVSFLSSFEYTPGLPAKITEEFFRKVNAAANGFTRSKAPPANRLLEVSSNSSLSNGHLSDALVPHKSGDSHRRGTYPYMDMTSYPALPAPEIYLVSNLFSPSPPSNLPPYPADSQALVSRKGANPPNEANHFAQKFLAQADHHEAVTYHPLLTDALHSLLLCHALMQTSPKEHLRHAHMVARLARVCDGYPIFLAARSPSRADWIEVVRRANNWIGLQQSWETLCAPAPLLGHAAGNKKEESEEQARERRKQEAIMEALADERVHDEASFQAAVTARERRAEELRQEETGQNNGPKRWAQEDGKEYPISTERAEAVARWVKEAPLTVEGAISKTKKGIKKGKTKRGTAMGVPELGDGLNSVGLDAHTEEAVEE
ncbi:MAG: hypothetical protein Q9191_000208 [Dirinaria sp. TL-2023a]